MFAAAEFHLVLHAEKIFTIGGVSITNSILLGWLVSILLIVLLIFTSRRMKIGGSGKFASIIELAVDGITNLTAQVMGDRAKARKYAPFLATLFLFILLNNWFGLMPGVGSINHGDVPLFRAWTADLTGTLALSISSIIIVQMYSIKELRPLGFLKHYFSDKPWNPINLFVGLLEILGEFTRIASLALRLFGNIFAGEVLLVVLSSITSWGTPAATLPFILLEFFVGFIQAFVFTMLVIVYLTLATSHHEESNHPRKSKPAMESMIAQGSPS